MTHEHQWRDTGFSTLEDCGVRDCRFTRDMYTKQVFPHYSSKHPIINVTVDARIIVGRTVTESPGLRYLLIRRGGEPFQGKLAMPGGFVNPDEHLHEAVRREVREETGLDLVFQPWDYLTYADKPDRDPRGRTISFVFDMWIDDEFVADAIAGDDAASIELVRVSDLKEEDCAFDHYELLKYYK